MRLKIYYVLAFTTIFSNFECRYEIPYHRLGGTAKELYGNGEFEFDEVCSFGLSRITLNIFLIEIFFLRTKLVKMKPQNTNLLQ